MGHVLTFGARGNREGNDLVLLDGSYTVGRGLDVELTLDEETLSRRHARFVVDGDRIQVEDLGSTNGTFVNGVQITGAVLKEGDAVVVGNCLIRYQGLSDDDGSRAVAEEAEARRHRALYDRSTADRKTSPEALAGDLETFPFTTLAQLLAASSASGCLRVDGRREISIYLRGGRLVGTAVDGNVVDDAEKVFLRALRWRHGNFVLVPHMEMDGGPRTNLDVNMLMLEGVRVIDELEQLDPLPGLDDLLYVPEPIIAPLRELTIEQLDTLQLCHNHHHVETILDRSRASDLETLRDISLLVGRGYLLRES